MNRELYIKIGTAFIILFLVFGVFWQFLWNSLKEMREEYIDSRITLAEVEQKAGLKSVLNRELEEAEEEVAIIERSLLNEGDTLEFIEAVEGLATENQIFYNTNTVQELKDASGKVTAINFNINLAGSFRAHLNFIRALKAMPYLLNFTQVSMGPGADGVINTRATLRVYVK